ncbi:MAG: N-6 DNA methylase [Acetobacteraceae bacterium]|nr:N-6 DNA methylase [Acetobacteraceae bacterium]
MSAQTARFKLIDVETDVLKVLYESLVDPDERHDFGGYYTPDWLAGRVVAEAVNEPLEQRVLDPACGSGTFLFHALRRIVAAGQAAGWSEERVVQCCAERVRGMDVHPVALTLARVTWLLALGRLLAGRKAKLTVPVFLGDAMQWNLRRFVDRAEVAINVPGETKPLRIPLGFAESQAIFEAGLDELNRGLADNATRDDVAKALRRIEGVSAADAESLAETFAQLQTLYRAGRNGIWTFVLRNLARPVWLSRDEQQADVLVGNPPWTVYRHLSSDMKDRLREALLSYDLWVGGHLATQQDVCALFWARGAEQYLKRDGRIAFVLPFAVLNAPVFANLRAGRMGKTQVHLTSAWALERVWPIFGAQSGSSRTSTCVLFGVRQMAGPHPTEIDRWEGRLSRRDADEAEARRALSHSRAVWPRARDLIGVSPYRARFRQGATVVPRRFFIVDPAPSSRLGRSAHAPIMQGRAGRLDKHPWTTVEPPRGPVEAEYLRQLVLGESIAPFRMLESVTAVIPLDGAAVLDAAGARAAGQRHLAAWLADIEAKWADHAKKTKDGRPRMTLTAQIDHMRKLSRQSGSTEVSRVLYTKAGTRLSAATLVASDAIVDHKAYWGSVRSTSEAGYLVAILNSEVVVGRISDLQGIGEAGTRRDLDNLAWTLPIPEYDDTDAIHRDLAAASVRAEAVARSVPLADAQHFVGKRRAVRDALAADGVAAEIEALVDALLPP